MRAMVLPAQAPISERPLERRRVPIPEPGRGEVLIIVTACAICRTDLHIAEGDLPLLRAPLVPGHQAVGRVLRAGPGDGGLLPGTRVGVAWLRWTCGTCAYCTSARENLCARAEFTGYHADGGYAEYAVVPQAYVYPLPPVFGDAEAAPLLCAGIIGYRALKLAAVAPGGTLGLYGFGSSAPVRALTAPSYSPKPRGSRSGRRSPAFRWRTPTMRSPCSRRDVSPAPVSWCLPAYDGGTRGRRS